MSYTPKRFVGPSPVDQTSEVVYTTPVAIQAIVRHIHVFNPSGDAITYTLSIGSDAAATRLYDGISIAAGAELDRHCYYPLAAGDTLESNASSDDVLVQTISGQIRAA